MLDPLASRFGQAVLLSGLMDAEGLKASWDAIPPEKRDAPEHIDRRLARQAVQSQVLTLWQAQQVLAGRTSGFKVDRYILLDLIGQGGMGRVYLARDSRLNRKVALKILAPERMSNPRAVARFHREARVGAQMQHENLVRVYDFGESGGRHFLVMEYIEGKTIGHLLAEQGPMPPATAARLVRQVAQALTHADRKGMIHRDVNPYNILVTHDGVAKLADLGLAIDMAESARVTRDGATVGTFDYVAPEQARHSHSADIRSDIYSLGCTLYHMLTGRVPFPSPSLPEKLFAHQAKEPTPLEQIVLGLPAGLGDVVRKMMRKQPDERYSSPSLVVQALEPFIDEGTAARGDLGWALSDATPQPGDLPRVAVPTRDANEPANGSVSSTEVPSSTASGAGTLALPQGSERPLAARAVTPATFVSPSRIAAPRASQPAAAAVADQPTPADAEVDLDAPDLPLLTPADDVPDDRLRLPIVVDLGPEPPLMSASVRSRTSSVSALGSLFSRTSSATPSGEVAAAGAVMPPTLAPDGLSIPTWARAVIAAAIVVILGFTLAAISGTFRRPATPVLPPGPSRRDDREKLAGPPPDRRTTRAAIVVGSEGDAPGHSTEEPAATLAEAIKKAMGRGVSGYVELRNGKPLTLGTSDIADLGKGTLQIRAARGMHPVIEVETDGKRSLLQTGPSLVLTLSGLTIRVRYRPAAGPAPAELAALIHATGRVTLDHCSLEVVGPGPAGSRAVFADGGNLTVDGCWFLGFDQPIRIRAFDETVASLRQTIIANGPASADATNLHGWALGLALEPGRERRTTEPGRDARAKIQRQLKLDRCTIEAAGLLDLGGNPGAAPMSVVVVHCAVRSDALLAWRPRKDGDPLGAHIEWRGEGNQWNVEEKSWVVGSSRTMTPAITLGVTDLKSWARFITGDGKFPKASEAAPSTTRITFATDPVKRRDPPRPLDYAIESTDSPEYRSGADADRVGPGGR